jgi:hypothetical protein
MADYFTNFSLVLLLKDEAQKQYALDLHKEAIAIAQRDGEPIPKSFPESLETHLEEWCFDIEKENRGVWLHSQYGGIDAACAFIQHLLVKFNPDGVVTFEWSHDCTKPRIDAYGGGAAIVTANKIKTMNTADWIRANDPAEPRKHLFSTETHLCIHCGIHADDDLVENQPCTH